MENKTMKEAMQEIEEMFYGIPELQNLFKKYERDIRFYNRYNWNEITTKEKLIQKRDELLQIAKTMGACELFILYYIKHMQTFGRFTIVKMLRELYVSQCNFKNKFYNTNEYEDILEIGQYKGLKKSEKSQKNPEK